MEFYLSKIGDLMAFSIPSELALEGFIELYLLGKKTIDSMYVIDLDSMAVLDC